VGVADLDEQPDWWCSAAGTADPLAGVGAVVKAELFNPGVQPVSGHAVGRTETAARR
jgi:hypothetical protein